MSTAKTQNVQVGQTPHTLEVLEWTRQTDDAPGKLKARIGDDELEASYRIMGAGLVQLQLPGRTMLVHLAQQAERCHVTTPGFCGDIKPAPRRRRGGGTEGELPQEVTPPTPAVIVRALVAVGDTVEKGQGVIVVSAMKMETTLKAPYAGEVKAINAAEGDRAMPGDVLVEITPVEAPPADE